jgi:hypothetical protein
MQIVLESGVRAGAGSARTTVAAAVMKRADADKDGKLTEEELTAFAAARPGRGRRADRARPGSGDVVAARRSRRPGRLALPHRLPAGRLAFPFVGRSEDRPPVTASKTPAVPTARLA